MSGTISSAVLRVYGKLDDNRNSNIPVNVHAVSNTTWTESAITWNNKPATGASLGSATVTDSIGRYYTWDITAYVQSGKSGRAQYHFPGFAEHHCYQSAYYLEFQRNGQQSTATGGYYGANIALQGLSKTIKAGEDEAAGKVTCSVSPIHSVKANTIQFYAGKTRAYQPDGI